MSEERSRIVLFVCAHRLITSGQEGAHQNAAIGMEFAAVHEVRVALHAAQCLPRVHVPNVDIQIVRGAGDEVLLRMPAHVGNAPGVA
jgi:hypothetical protein